MSVTQLLAHEGRVMSLTVGISIPAESILYAQPFVCVC